MLTAYISCPKNMYESLIFERTCKILRNNKINCLYWRPNQQYSIDSTDRLIKESVDFFIYIPEDNKYNIRFSDMTAGSRREVSLAFKESNLRILIPYTLVGDGTTNLYTTRVSQDGFFLLGDTRITNLLDFARNNKKETLDDSGSLQSVLCENKKSTEKYSYNQNLLLYLK